MTDLLSASIGQWMRKLYACAYQTAENAGPQVLYECFPNDGEFYGHDAYVNHYLTLRKGKVCGTEVEFKILMLFCLFRFIEKKGEFMSYKLWLESDEIELCTVLLQALEDPRTLEILFFSYQLNN